MPTATAHLGTHTLASTTTPQFIEGNVYFPPSSITDPSLLKPSDAPKTVCPWKGTASYYDIDAGEGEVVRGGAWYYPEPKTERAAGLKGWVAFCE